MILVGISGKRRSGKTTLANLLEATYNFHHFSLANVLKQELRDLYQLSKAHTDGPLKELFIDIGGLGVVTPRKLMIWYGKLKRQETPNYWIDRLKEQMFKVPQAQLQKAVVSDIRFLNEAEWVKEHGGYLIRLERAPELTGDYIDDESETALDAYKEWNLRIPESANVDMTDLIKVAEHLDLLLPEWEKQKGRLNVA